MEKIRILFARLMIIGKLKIKISFVRLRILAIDVRISFVRLRILAINVKTFFVERKVFFSFLAMGIILSMGWLASDDTFWMYWMLVATVIYGVVMAARYLEVVGNFVGDLIGEICSNNNYRLGALYVLALVFTISAILAGFGEPVLSGSFNEVVKTTKNASIDNEAVKGLHYVLFGTKNIASTVDIPTKNNYSSWAHIFIAIFLWLAAFVYTPIALREEAAAAYAAVTKRRQNLISTSVAGKVPEEKSSSDDNKHSGMKDFLRIMSVDLLMEFGQVVFKKFFKIK